MHRVERLRVRLWALVLLPAALAGAAAARADALSAVQVLRAGGCGGILPAAPPLRRDGRLDRVARDWATGLALPSAAARGGYPTAATVGVHVSAAESSLLQRLRSSDCRTVMEPALREVGLYRAGLESWLVMTRPQAAQAGVPPQLAPPRLASVTPRPPAITPPVSAPVTSPVRATTQPPVTPAQASRALTLVNDVRAHGTRCGNRSFAPAPPVVLSGTLGGVAFGHAADMAVHGYFEHQDLTGQSPADRVRAVGYREKLVGENIAYGPQTVEEVVRGWLDSPDHCENIMDPRFAEMGIASAAGRTGRRGLYWVQVLAEPRA
jgi:uncharacterized protein YkwD